MTVGLVMHEMFRKNRGGVGSWRIWAEGNRIRMAHAIVAGGQEIFHEEVVPAGLAGRSLAEQVQSRVQSRINKQRDRGYVDLFDDALKGELLNTMGFPPPMLAKKIQDLRGFPGQCVTQQKFDGFRCLTTRNNDGDVVCYSRQGKPLEALVHIIDAFKDSLPDGIILDGEIYRHGVPLQTIASWAKKLQTQTGTLIYHVYDSVSSDSFPHRYGDAKDVINNTHSNSVVIVKNKIVNTEAEMWEQFAIHRADGYEGAMLRTLHTPYESGTRSSSLYKVKARHDAEFRVIDVVPGSDGLGILVCEMENGKRFRTLAPGDHTQKRFILVHKDQYIGREVTVEYANLTSDGIPFHGVATRFKETEI